MPLRPRATPHPPLPGSLPGPPCQRKGAPAPGEHVPASQRGDKSFTSFLSNDRALQEQQPGRSKTTFTLSPPSEVTGKKLCL
ncbi:hypothetical protein AV530_012263 [Patagioenas fasciata monilis]|uniref:Uncharacterized protein n=1 Tax=Patagioenas fasciata monilis TaxID=372326 RepID=A0A1V4J2H0_PATFA|nr:hypothetical protein AV530_012263 [Patagioenas fasciata monilis]